MEEGGIIGNRGKFGVQVWRAVTTHCLSGFRGTIRSEQEIAVEMHFSGA